MRALGSGILALMLAPALAGAATITPTPGFFADDFADNANCSLREAIEVANDDAEGGPEDSCVVEGAVGDDTVLLGPGTYVLGIQGLVDEITPTNASDDLDVSTTDGSMTIEGAGAAQTTIDTDPPPTTWSDRVLEHDGGNLLTVRDLTLTGGGFPGAVEQGGGIRSQGALTIERARITGNEAVHGGGVFGFGPLTVKDSLIDGNHAGRGAPTFSDPSGGGVAGAGQSITISSSIIRENSVSAGGAVFPPSAARGGGVFLAPWAAASVSGSAIADNETVTGPTGFSGGAGIYIDLTGSGAAETVRLSRSTVSGNDALAGTNGGSAGVYVIADAHDLVHMVNSTVTANRGLRGGALLGNGGTVNVIHSTFGPNESADATALSQFGGTMNVRGSVIDTGSGPACEGTINSQGGNVVRTTLCLTGGPGNDAENVDPQLGGLAANGGPSAGPTGFAEPILTHLPAASSPAVDRVAANDCENEFLAPLTLDQRGLPRPVDNDGDSAAECESGSVELEAPPVTAPPPATAPSPTGADEDPACDRLRKKLKRAKKKLRRAKKKGQAKKRGQAKKKTTKLRRKLRRRGC